MGQPAAGISKRLLFFSHENWDEIWRRNQFICAGLAKRHPELQILWVTRGIDLWLFDRNTIRQSKFGKPAPSDLDRLITVCPTKALPNRIGRALNTWLIRRQVLGGMNELGWNGQHCVVWVNNEVARPLMPIPGMTSLIYDITDDWSKASLTASGIKRAVSQDEWYLKQSDQVIVCSRQLYKDKEGLCKNLSFVPNGVEFERYHPRSLSLTQKPADMSNLRGPIVGYIGTLHEDRLDIELICSTAKKLTHFQFVFVGPNALSRESLSLIGKLPNCHLLGSRPYKDLPSYLACFDICFVPHKVTPFTESLDPLKLYEYMSTGKPVVATPCAGFRECGHLISIANGHDQFVEALQSAADGTNDSHEKQNERLAWAAEQSWDKRLDIVELLLGWKT